MILWGALVENYYETYHIRDWGIELSSVKRITNIVM